MSLENDIRLLLKEKPMTVNELSEKLGFPPETIDSFTGFKMIDVYEEDDGKLKLEGAYYEAFHDSDKDRMEAASQKLDTQFTEDSVKHPLLVAQDKPKIMSRKEKRGRLIVQLRNSGLSWDEVARKAKVSIRSVRSICVQWSRR